MPSEPGPQLVIVILAIIKVDEARKVNSAALGKDLDCRNSNIQRGARVQPRDVLSFAQTCSFSGQTCGECEKYSVGGRYRARVPAPSLPSGRTSPSRAQPHRISPTPAVL